VQYGSEACSSKRFRKWIERLLNMAEERDMQLRLLGMGDYTDSLRPSIRKAYMQAVALNEDEHIVKGLLKEIKRHEDGFCKLVEGTEELWLGMLEGHHYFDYGNGVTSDTIIADRLGATFLGDCARIHLTFERTRLNGHGSATDFQIWCHHGEGGGAMPGAPLNKLNPMVGRFEADAFLIPLLSKYSLVLINICQFSSISQDSKVTICWCTLVQGAPFLHNTFPVGLVTSSGAPRLGMCSTMNHT